MRYVTLEEYAALIPDGNATQQELTQAECDVDSLTFGRVHALGMDALSELQQKLIRQAVCRQAEFLRDYASMLESPLSAYSINGVSMQWNDKQLVRQSGVTTTSGVYALLRQTGLTYRGLDWRQEPCNGRS